MTSPRLPIPENNRVPGPKARASSMTLLALLAFLAVGQGCKTERDATPSEVFYAPVPNPVAVPTPAVVPPEPPPDPFPNLPGTYEDKNGRRVLSVDRETSGLFRFI